MLWKLDRPGIIVQDYSKTCTVYYTCKMPGESNTAYERRVIHDIQIGSQRS